MIRLSTEAVWEQVQVEKRCFSFRLDNRTSACYHDEKWKRKVRVGLIFTTIWAEMTAQNDSSVDESKAGRQSYSKKGDKMMSKSNKRQDGRLTVRVRRSAIGEMCPADIDNDRQLWGSMSESSERRPSTQKRSLPVWAFAGASFKDFASVGHNCKHICSSSNCRNLNWHTHCQPYYI